MTGPGRYARRFDRAAHGAERNKAFHDPGSVGLAIHATTAGHSTRLGCQFYGPQNNPEKI